MSRQGLTEENLRDGTKKDISSSKKKNYRMKVSDDGVMRVRHSMDTKSSRALAEDSDIKEKDKRKRQKKQYRSQMAREGKELKEKPQYAKQVEEKNKSARKMGEKSKSAEKVGERPSEKSIEEKELDSKKLRKKKQVQNHARKEAKANEKLETEQKAKASRLSFEDEEKRMTKGAGSNLTRKVVSTAAYATRLKMESESDDNAGIKSASASERALEDVTRSLKNVQMKPKKGRLNFGTSELDAEKLRGTGYGKEAVESANKKNQQIRKFWQKKRYKKSYAAVKQGAKAQAEAIRVTESVAGKAKRILEELIRRNKSLFLSMGLMAMVFLIIAASLGSCAASIQGAGTTIFSTTYAATDSNIYATENAYKALEEALDRQINNMESTHPDYDEYRYQIDEIGHNPYHLISYFTVKYGEFTYNQVKAEVEEIFREQYSLSTQSQRETVTETRTVRVGESLGQVVTSGYCNCTICCGQWSGGPTASGAMPSANHTIAVDANSPFVPMGTHVVMNGVEYVVEDTGAFARYGVQFDVYYDSHSAASAHGHQTWEAYIADSNGSQEVEVTSTRVVNRFSVTLNNHSLDSVLRSRMNEEEEQRYDYYNITYGNRDYLFDLSTISPGGGGGFGYQIPAEALSDRKFANMIKEAEKYLGYPYVWGGASPSTSFDCSGYVSWVINNCGNGWNVGRQTADGLRSYCARVSPSEAKPGDLIFFQGTYNTPGASHVGIYVGNNMMIHCGNPIQYTSIATSYWQQHFLAFGRLN